MLSVKLVSLVLAAISISKLVSAVPFPSPVPSPSPTPSGGSSPRDWNEVFDYNAADGQNVDDIFRHRSPRSPHNSQGVISTSHNDAGTSTGQQAPTMGRRASASVSASLLRSASRRREANDTSETFDNLSDDQKRRLTSILTRFMDRAKELRRSISIGGFTNWAARHMTEDIKSGLFSGDATSEHEAVEAILAEAQHAMSTSQYRSRVGGRFSNSH